MAHADRRAGIYIQLDALLDTRLGTIAQHWGDEVALNVLKTGYHTRMSDSFAGVDKDVYQAQYENRSVDTLVYSRVTNTGSLVRQLVAVLADQSINDPTHDGAKIVVNVYPYELTSEERDLMGKSIALWTDHLAPVELVFMRPEDLTPVHCKQNYSVMFVYEYEQWYNIHNAALNEVGIPDVDLFAPALFKVGNLPTAEELEQVTREVAHPFKATQLALAPVVHLQLIDVKHFSVLSRLDLEPAYSPSPTEPVASATAFSRGGVPDTGFELL